MKSCESTEYLEKYVLGLLNAEASKQVGSHIAKCTECRKKVKTIKQYYEEVQSVSDLDIDTCLSQVNQKMQVYTLHDIPLYPIKTAKKSNTTYLLAADDQPCRHVTVQSYTNENEDLLARILQDNQTGEVTLFLISETEDPWEEAILEIEDSNKTFVLQKDGKVILSDIDIDELIYKTLYLKSPKAVFDLTPMEELKEKVVLEGKFQIKSQNFDQIQIELHNEHSQERYTFRIQKVKGMTDYQAVQVVVSQKNGNKVSSPVHEGIAVFEDLNLEKILKITVY
ncbi:MAG: hypothetical protein R6V04_04465 [bacterium]